MTAKKTDDTATALHSTPTEIEAKAHPVRPDAIAETPPPETPKRKTTSVQSACRNHAEVRKWLIRTTLTREAGAGHTAYNLDSFQGPTASLPEIIEHYVKEHIVLARDEQRLRNLLKPHELVPTPAPSIVVQRGMASAIDGNLQPQLKRATGPSEYAEVVAKIILLRSLDAATDRAAMLAVKAETVRLEIALLYRIERFRPFERPGPKPNGDSKVMQGVRPTTMLFDDSAGRGVGVARMELATAIEVCRQRERMREYFLALKKSNRWLAELLVDVDRAVAAQVDEQEKRDRAAQRTEALAMLSAGYETDHKGLRWDRFLSEQERTELADRKTELERDLSETENK